MQLLTKANSKNSKTYLVTLVLRFFRLKDFTTEDIDETGSSYEENAMLKAKKASELSNHPSLGDDSGLEVKLLNNDPWAFFC